MTLLIRTIDGGERVFKDPEEYYKIMKDYVRRSFLRRDIYRERGVVKIESDHEVGLYSKEGLNIDILNCSREQIEKFQKYEGRFIKPIPVIECDAGYGKLHHIPLIII